MGEDYEPIPLVWKCSKCGEDVADPDVESHAESHDNES